MAQYGTIITSAGEALLTNSFLLGQKVEITHMAVGDGGGYYQPNPGMTGLINEVERVEVNSVELDADSANVIVVTALIPSDVGGFTIREAGAFDADGNMVAVMNTPDTQKVADQGADSDLYVRMRLAVSYTDSIQFKTDATTILATRKDIEVHDTDEESHPYLLAQLSTKAQEAAATLAAHNAAPDAHGDIREALGEIDLQLADKVSTADLAEGIANATVTISGDIEATGTLSEEITATIADDAVTTSKIADNAVTADKILNCAALSTQIALGTNASAGTFSVALGSNSSATGQDSIAIGRVANCSGTFSAAIGVSSRSAYTNSFVLGQSASATTSNQVLLGNDSMKPYAYGALTVLSDRRDKTDISDFEYDPLDFINRLNPVQYRMDPRVAYTREEEISEAQYEALDEHSRKHKVREIPVYTLGDVQYVELLDEDKPDRYKAVLTSNVYRSREDALLAYGEGADEVLEEQTGTIKLLTVQLDSNGDFAGKRYHNGFIAQEVRDVADDMGFDFAGINDHSVNGGEDMISLTYEEFISPMVAAIQELTKQNKELTARIEALESTG